MNDVRAANDAHQLAVMRNGNAAKTIPHHRFGHLTDLILRLNCRDRLGHHVGGFKVAGSFVYFGDILRLDKLVEYRWRMHSQRTNSFLFQKKIAIADYADHLALAVYDRHAADAMFLEQSDDLLKGGAARTAITSLVMTSTTFILPTPSSSVGRSIERSAKRTTSTEHDALVTTPVETLPRKNLCSAPFRPLEPMKMQFAPQVSASSMSARCGSPFIIFDETANPASDISAIAAS
jgi:hypothetical protein